MTTNFLGGRGPEGDVALDMAKLGGIVGPVVIGVSLLIWGVPGLISSSLAFAIVVFNLLFGAWLIAMAIAISTQFLMPAMLGGFVMRLGLLTAIVIPIRNQDWFAVTPFAIALIGGHLGLLAWETQRVSASLAHPGMPPSKRSPLEAARMRSESE